jgi:hypothetical protein
MIPVVHAHLPRRAWLSNVGGGPSRQPPPLHLPPLSLPLRSRLAALLGGLLVRASPGSKGRVALLPRRAPMKSLGSLMLRMAAPRKRQHNHLPDQGLHTRRTHVHARIDRGNRANAAGHYRTGKRSISPAVRLRQTPKSAPSI